MSTIDEILWRLKNGKWHTLTEIIEESPLPKPITKMTLNFLREYNFIQIDENKQKAKLCPLLLNFLDEIQRIEKEETLSHKSFKGAIGANKFASLRRSFEKV